MRNWINKDTEIYCSFAKEAGNTGCQMMNTAFHYYGLNKITKLVPIGMFFRGSSILLAVLAIYFAWVPLPAPGAPNNIRFTYYLPNFVFFINCSYWELINLVWTWVTVSIATTTTISIDVPPR